MPDTKPTPKDYTARAAFSVDEWCTDIYPMARAYAYAEMNSGALRSYKRGSRREIPATERADYPARKLAEAQAMAATKTEAAA